MALAGDDFDRQWVRRPNSDRRQPLALSLFSCVTLVALLGEYWAWHGLKAKAKAKG